jgi:hypothetical protein
VGIAPDACGNPHCGPRLRFLQEQALILAHKIPSDVRGHGNNPKCIFALRLMLTKKWSHLEYTDSHFEAKQKWTKLYMIQLVILVINIHLLVVISKISINSQVSKTKFEKNCHQNIYFRAMQMDFMASPNKLQ